MYNFDEIIERRNTNCAKWDEVEADMLPMWVADMDFKCPPEVIDALVKRAEHGVFGYTGDYNSYYISIINWMKKRHNWVVKKEWICTSPGIVPALDMLVRAFTHPGDKVIVQPPVYSPFYTVVRTNGCHVVTNPLQYDGEKYHIDFEHLENLFDPRVKLLILCSPHNPVTRVWKKQELQKLGELCRDHGVIVIADEIHSDLIYPGYMHTVFASISPELEQNCVICNAPSKTFNIAGIQASNIIIPNEKIRIAYRNIVDSNGLYLPNVFALTALEAAYNYGEKWLEELMVYLKENFDFLKSFITENLPKVKVIEPEGTYLVWMDFRALGIDDQEIDKILKEKARLVLEPGRLFGTIGSGFQRINIACPRSLLQEGLERLAKTLNK